MIFKMAQKAPEVIFAKPEVTCSNGSEIFMTGNDFHKPLNVVLMLYLDIYALKIV